MDPKGISFQHLGEAKAESGEVEVSFSLVVENNHDGDMPTKKLSSSSVDIEKEVPWHLLSVSEVLEKLDARTEGLSAPEAEMRLHQHGQNVFEESDSRDKFHNKSLLKFTNGIQVMLALSGTLSFINYFALTNLNGPETITDYQKVILGSILFVIVILTAWFQKHQEHKAEKIFNALNKLAPLLATVYRDGHLETISASLLVPGDVIKISAGERVPADIRILDSCELKVNRKVMTGESVLQSVGMHADDLRLNSANNIVLCGCVVASGYAIGIVYATGATTYLNSVNRGQTSLANLIQQSSLKDEVTTLIKCVSVASIVIGIPFFILALKGGYSIAGCISLLIGVIVANIPISLLPQISVSFSLVAKKLMSQNIFVSRLDIMDTMGQIDVLCMDKTGTVTEPKLDASHIMFDLTLLPCANVFDAPTDLFRTAVEGKVGFLGLMHCACLSTEVEVDEAVDSAASDFLDELADNQSGKSSFGVRQDETECAIVAFANHFCPITSYRKEFRRIFSLPFSSSQRYMLIIYAQDMSERDVLGNDWPMYEQQQVDSAVEKGPTRPFLAVIKGAPETIMKMCSSILVDGRVVPLTREHMETARARNTKVAQGGERVIAFAQQSLSLADYPPSHDFLESEKSAKKMRPSGFTYMGFLTFTEKLREGIDTTVSLLKRAGVRVFLITGDHPINAKVIAKKAKVITRPSRASLVARGVVVADDFRGSMTICGGDVSDFSDADWDGLLKNKEIVFSQMMPHQKEEVVLQLRKRGFIVAMLGDGVNDAPALKKANLSIAMGSGVQVAKDAAHIILIDDNVRGLAIIVQEGRRIMINMAKTIDYIMSSNIPELVPFLIFSTYRCPRAIDSLTMLLFEVLLNVAPAVCFSYEEVEGSVMRNPCSHSSIVNVKNISYSYLIGLFLTAAAYWTFLNTFKFHGFSLATLENSGPHYRDEYSTLSPERKAFFLDMCTSHPEFHAYQANDGSCDVDAFQAFRIDVLGRAQAAYLLILVLGQAGNCIAQRTTTVPLLTSGRIFKNLRLWVSLLCGSLVAVILVYNNATNDGFLLNPPDAEAAAVGLWIFPFVILWEDARKWLQYPGKWGVMDD